jgi:hypothetical protein
LSGFHSQSARPVTARFSHLASRPPAKSWNVEFNATVFGETDPEPTASDVADL